MEQCLNGSVWALQGLRHFGNREAEIEAEDDRGSLAVRQPADGIEQVGAFREWLRGLRIDETFRCPLLRGATAEIRMREVDADPVSPCFGRPHRSHPLPVSAHTSERFLSQLLGHIAVTAIEPERAHEAGELHLTESDQIRRRLAQAFFSLLS